jgi:hypothetical protein
MDMIPYALAFGSIMYVMICTRPDVFYACITSRYQSDHGKRYWTTVSTKDEFLVVGGESELGVKG